MLGDFLEISLTTPDMLASLEFYCKLGFEEAPVGGGRKHPYAVVTDGRLYLGLHKREPAPPALSFVLPELRNHVASFEALGIEFDSLNIAIDQFNALSFQDPDGGGIELLEARTYSPVHAGHVQPTLCGYFMEYRLPVRDSAASVRFWEALGLIVEPTSPEGPPYPQASWGGINLALKPASARGKPTLVFAHPVPDEIEPLLEMRGLAIQNDTEGLVLTSPEGINLLLRHDA